MNRPIYLRSLKSSYTQHNITEMVNESAKRPRCKMIHFSLSNNHLLKTTTSSHSYGSIALIISNIGPYECNKLSSLINRSLMPESHLNFDLGFRLVQTKV